MKNLATLLALALTLPLAAQDMPTPGPQHTELAAQVGVWNADLELLGPTGEWMNSKGVSKRTMLGGFWILDSFEAEMMGMKFTGLGQSGYDPLKEKYVSTWTDSMSPYLSVMEGNYDDSGKVLTMTGKAIGMDGKMTDYRYVTTVKSDDVHTFEMYMKGLDGKMMKSMKITYTRQEEGGKKASDAGAKRKR